MSEQKFGERFWHDYDLNTEAEKLLLLSMNICASDTLPNPRRSGKVIIKAAPVSATTEVPYDPVPSWLRNQITGTIPDVASGPMPDTSGAFDFGGPIPGSAPYFTGESATPVPVADGGIPTSLRNGQYRAPDGSRYQVNNGRRYRVADTTAGNGSGIEEGALVEGRDGYLYRIVNGQPQRTNLRRRAR